MKMYWSTRRHRTKLLSLLCALAIFVSLIPAVSAADIQDVLKNNTITDTVTPAGVQINLFDYWVTERTAVDNGIQWTQATGINTGHDLRFMAIGDGKNDGIRINKYTGSNGVRSGIVQDRLSGGYPVLKSGNKTGLNENDGLSREQSLAYLFDKSEEITNKDGSKSGTLGKKTFWDVSGLLQVDDHGYYYFNADNNKAGNGKPYQSANYAYFNETGEKAGSFTVYNTYGINKFGNGDQQGQFFPFNSPSSLDIFTENNGKLVPNMGIDSQNQAINHLFGLSMITRFVQRYGGMTTERGDDAMTFQFAGDDDVWIFIDGVLVADLGGIHDQATTTINFSDGTITINGNDAGTLKGKMSKYYGKDSYWATGKNTFADNTYHTLKLFYLERGGTDSNLAMKFNLAYVPETDGIKVDQNGKLLPGVQFDLYAAQRKEMTDGTYKYIKTNEAPIGSGTTDENGRFVLTNADDIAVSLNDLNKRNIQYLILEEQNKSRTGYRHDDSIYLVLQSKEDVDTDTVLLNDENHRWTTGTYAALKGTVSTGPDITLSDTLSDTDKKINLDTAGGKLFAVIMRRLENVGKSKPSTEDKWGVVTGSALSGWQVTGRRSDGRYIPAVIEALQNKAEANGNAVVFTPAANGSYMAELKNCPGDLRNYYYWRNNVDTAYNVAFYYTEASKLSQATEENTYRVDGKDFDRQFAATIYIPNVKHYLNVQKVDETGTAVPGATFSLYKKDDLTVDEKTGTYTIREEAKPYDTVITGTDGKAQFPSKGHVLAAGKYYLVENSAPVGYTVNPTPVPVIVDDTHGVIADAGTDNDGISVNVSEGTLVPTMTPFATNDAIDHSLTDVTTTRMEAPSGGWNPNLTASTTEEAQVNLTLKQDGSMSYTSNTDRDCWSTKTGWLWFRITQTPFTEAPLKTDLSRYDLTRLFSGKTTVVVTDQRVGSLEIRKTVTDLTNKATDLPNSYALEIALNDSDYNGEVSYTSEGGNAAAPTGKLHFTGGKTTYDIQRDETLTLLDLPFGTTWRVKETADLPAENWRTTVNGQTGKEASGEIKEAEQRATVAIVNSYDKYNDYAGTLTGFRASKTYATGEGKAIYDGSVTFKLEATGANAASAPLPPTQTEISLTKEQIEKGDAESFGKLTFTSTGTYTYTVKEVKTPTIPGMDYDDAVYTITVSVTEGNRQLIPTVASFTVTRSGETTNLPTSGIPLCTFKNSYTPAPTTGTLTVTKEVKTAPNSTAPDEKQTFPIQITLKNADGNAYTGTIGNLIFGKEGTTWNAKNGDSLTLTLPVGTTWTVREGTLTNAERWDTKYKVNNVDAASASGAISTTPSAVDIINTYDYVENPAKTEATIKVSKSYNTSDVYDGSVTFQITGSEGAPMPASTTVSLTKDQIVAKETASFGKLTFKTAGTYTYTVNEVNEGVEDMTYSATVYTVTFEVERGAGSDRNKLVATPTYTVVEKPGAASNPYLYTDTTGLLFTNTYNPGSSEEQDKGSLSIHKTLENPKNATTGLPKNYEIKITLSHYDGISSSSQIGSSEPQSVTLTFDANGIATYHIQAGETLTLSNLPVGTQWTVTETAQLDSKYWRTAYKVNGQDATTVSDKISAANETDAVIITNTYDPNGGEIVPGDTGSLTIHKTVGDGIDMRLSFNFSVLLTYPNQTTETRTLTVPANGSVTISDLPVGTLYAVTETTTGYTVTATNATGRIPVGGTTAAFHNALTGGDVPGPGPGPNPGGDDGGTPALNRRDHYAYIIGYPDGNVHPQGNITRAEVATIFFRLLRDPVRTQYWSQTNSYSDVAGDKWYNNAISTLSNMGIICGYPDGTFRPGAPITRAELTKIAASFFADPRVAREYDGRFSDVKGSEWYIAYLMKAIEKALIYGYPDGTFGPNRPITRAETCAIVNRTLGRKPDKDHLLPELVMITWPDNLRPLAWYYAHMQEATNSHDYSWRWQNGEQMENWTGKLRERDWAALERTWSHAHSAPGGEVMQ